MRYQFIGITLSKPHLVCTFYNKQINAKKYEWKFGSVQILMARQCIRIHLVEKQKEFIASQKTLLQHELSQCKSETEKKYVRVLYRPSTLRDLTKGRDSWGDIEDVLAISDEINLFTR